MGSECFVGVGEGPYNFFLFWSSTNFTEIRKDLPREAIGPVGSNCFSIGVRTSIIKEIAIATCNFRGSGSSVLPWTLPWSQQRQICLNTPSPPTMEKLERAQRPKTIKPGTNTTHTHNRSKNIGFAYVRIQNISSWWWSNQGLQCLPKSMSHKVR